MRAPLHTRAERFILAQTEPDLYWMDLDLDEAACARFAALLAPEERRWAERLHFDLHRRRYVVRRGRLRELLAQRLDCHPRDVPVTYNAFGKPRVEGTDLRFNLSHSRGVALFAFSRGLEIGCDIEWQDSRVAILETAGMFFSRREFDSLLSLPESQRTDGFFNCWTRKEAFIKARDGGFSLPLDTFDVALAPDEAAVFLSGGLGWSIQAFRPVEGLHAAIVIENRIDQSEASLD